MVVWVFQVMRMEKVYVHLHILAAHVLEMVLLHHSPSTIPGFCVYLGGLSGRVH